MTAEIFESLLIYASVVCFLFTVLIAIYINWQLKQIREIFDKIDGRMTDVSASLSDAKMTVALLEIEFKSKLKRK